MKTLVFVYGTLKNGHHNNHLLSGAFYVGKAHTTQPKYQMYHLGSFPAVTDNGDKVIQGEIFEVDTQTLANLDHLEGHPNFYERRLVDVGLYGENHVRKAHMYLFKGDVTDNMPIEVWR